MKKFILILTFVFPSTTVLADSCGTYIMIENRSANSHLVRFIVHAEEVTKIPDENEDIKEFKQRGGQFSRSKPKSLEKVSLIVPCGMGFVVPPNGFWLSYKIWGESKTNTAKLTENLKITIE